MRPHRFLFACLLVAATQVVPAVGLPLPPLPPCLDPRGCPDLVVDQATMAPRLVTETMLPNDCQVVEGMVDPGRRRLMRFTFTTPNQGPGDVLIGRPEDRPDVFVYHNCHRHYHFREYADYRLWQPDQFAAWDALRASSASATPAEVLAAHPELQPVVGGKRGFCMIDLRRYQALALSKYNDCGFQGISVGWADEYYWGLDGQFVDVTNVAAGAYVLEAEVNAERFLGEVNFKNNRAWVNVNVTP